MANSKHIFIGLGGSGCQTVAQIKEKVYAKRFPTATETKSRLQAMNDDYRFIFIDTDSRDIEEANKRNRDSFEYGKVPFISPQTDLVALGRANPQSIYYEAKQEPDILINKRILEACSPELSVKIPDQPLAFGAGAFRMKSRIAFAHSLTDFQTKIQAAISALNDVKTVGGEDCNIFYWVVCSTLGGTGSGIFNDVLYHLNQLHRQIVGTGDPQLVLTMYMPKVYIDSNATEEKYALNAFGVFSEVEAFKKMSYNDNQKTVMHRMAFVNDYNLIDANRRYCPFYYLIPIDIQTDKGTSLGTTRTMYRNTAEMLYHLHAGQGGDTFRSDIDNYMNDIMERDHRNFLVPMGYVSLQKPNEQFHRYFACRLKRDILRSWMLNESLKSEMEDSEVVKLFDELFEYCDPRKTGSFANEMTKKFNELIDIVGQLSSESTNELKDDQYKLDKFDVGEVIKKVQNESKLEKKEEHKARLNETIWRAAEEMIKKYGVVYTIAAIEKVKEYAKEMYDKFEDGGAENAMGRNARETLIAEMEEELPKLEHDAYEVKLVEKVKKSNTEDIQRYASKLGEWLEAKRSLAIDVWRFDLLKDFCKDDKNDELSKLRKHLARFEDKAKEMNREAVAAYKKLANEFGNTALDVTTVYLPMLKDICDGDGWKQMNLFSKLYQTIINAQADKEETPDRKDICDFINKNIYNTVNEQMKEEIVKDQYIYYSTKPDPKHKGQEIKTEEVRFFSLAELERNPEKVLDDFLRYAQKMLEKVSSESQDIQDKWENKKISTFFNDLTNDQKDEVRRSLNPALFFSYNNQRIDVVKKEEHIVFVAGSEDLARDMLCFEKGNPKHRFEQGADENSALVLKSKYGLALEDYRIYDSIKMVYEKATFREKYHFHHDFAQFKDQITLNDLPDDILDQHRTFAKLLLLDRFRKEFAPLFYTDEYDEESFTDTMLIPGIVDFKIARPEAFSIKDGKICLRLEEMGRSFYEEIEGNTFTEQFAKYSELYYNQRYGGTLNNIILEIQKSRQKIKIGKEEMTPEDILKTLYETKRNELLKELSDKKKNSPEMSDRRLYSILFDLVRNKYVTMHDFVGK